MENEVRAESIVEMNKGILKVIIDTCKIHGNDPQTGSMINAAMVMAINDLDNAFPGTRFVIKEMLAQQMDKK